MGDTAASSLKSQGWILLKQVIEAVASKNTYNL